MLLSLVLRRLHILRTRARCTHRPYVEIRRVFFRIPLRGRWGRLVELSNKRLGGWSCPLRFLLLLELILQRPTILMLQPHSFALLLLSPCPSIVIKRRALLFRTRCYVAWEMHLRIKISENSGYLCLSLHFWEGIPEPHFFYFLHGHFAQFLPHSAIPQELNMSFPLHI